MNTIKVDGKNIAINEQGYLLNLDEWSEAYTKEIAKKDNIELYNDHWVIIFYFREYYLENDASPTMHQMIVNLMPKNIKFHDKKKYEKHIYSLFPSDPIREICKLAGLPMPEADT